MNTERSTIFLKNYIFYPNNVQFRIVSSREIVKWKETKSFNLNQLVNGRFYFPKKIREILLLKYDIATRWLFEVENYFIERYKEKSFITEDELHYIVSLAIKANNKFKSTIKENPEHFDSKFAKIWEELHNITANFFYELITSVEGIYEYAFGQIVDHLCETMNYTLIEIYELNEIFKKLDKTDYLDDIFIVHTEFCNKFFERRGYCMQKERLAIYKKHFKFDTVWIKNYTNEPINAELLKTIQSLNLKINYEKCLFDI